MNHFPDTDGSSSDQGRNYEQEKNLAQTLINHYWVQNLNISVTWEDCPSFPVLGSAASHVRAAITNGSGGLTSLGKTALQPDSAGDTQPAMLFGIGGNPVNSKTRMDLFQALALHEFGHVLGFEDEHFRGDIPNQRCPNGAWRDTWLNHNPNHYSVWDAGAITPLNTFDYGSIMAFSYCDDRNIVPSLKDILAAQNLFGPAPDYDGDGKVGSSDNCPMTYNPDQSNCNLEYEIAKQARSAFFVEKLGDACDPVPCPNLASTSNTTPGASARGFGCDSSDPYIKFVRAIRDEIQVTPVGSRVRRPSAPIGTPVETTVPNVATHFRYCKTVQARDIDCNRSDVLINSMLEPGRSDTSVLEVNKDSPWQRITTRLAGTSTTIPRSSNTGIAFSYGGNATHGVYWDYINDNEFWHSSTRDLWAVGNLASTEPCKDPLFGIGTCLSDGYIWAHAATAVGSNDTDYSWEDRQDLSNRIVAFEPDAISVQACIPHALPDSLPSYNPCEVSPDGCQGKLFVRPTDCLTCDHGPLPDLTRNRILPITPTVIGHAVLYSGHYRFHMDTIGFDPNYSSLIQTGVHFEERLSRSNFVSSVEFSGPHVGHIDAVALSVHHLTGLQTLERTNDGYEWGYVPAEPGAMWPAWADVEDVDLIPDGRQRAYGRLNPRVLYSRERATVFIVGGVDDYGTPVQDVEFLTLSGSYGTVDGDEISDRVLAATLTEVAGSPYTFMLWTIEKTSTGATLRRRELATLLGGTLSVPHLDQPIDFDEDASYKLAQSDDGPDDVILSVSNFNLQTWGVFGVHATSSSVPDISIVAIVNGEHFAHDRFLYGMPHVTGNHSIVLPVLMPPWQEMGHTARHPGAVYFVRELGLEANILPLSLNTWVN